MEKIIKTILRQTWGKNFVFVLKLTSVQQIQKMDRFRVLRLHKRRVIVKVVKK